MADGGEATEPDAASLQVALTFLEGERERERQRTTSTRERAGAVLRNAGLLFALVTGIASLVGRDFGWGVVSALAVFVLALVCAIAFALGADWNVKSESVSLETLRALPKRAWEEDQAHTQFHVVTRHVDDITSLREANDGIVKLLRSSHVAMAAATVVGFVVVLAVMF